MRQAVACLALSLAAFVLAAACADRPEPGAASAAPGKGSDGMFTESDAYERFMGRWSRLLAPELVRFAGVADGEAVLDVGSGTGAVAAAIIASTTSTSVTGIDPSSAYVGHAAATVADDRAVFEVGDGQQMRFADDRFDRTVSLLVMNFIPDAGRAVDEMVRVTRDGGVVAAVVWDYGGGMEMLRVFWDEAVALDPAAETRDERHMPLCRAGELAALWRAHGLTQVEEAPLVIDTMFASFDDYWAPFLAGQGPAGAYVASLSADRQQALADRLQARLAAGPDGAIRLRAQAWAVKGVVPAR